MGSAKYEVEKFTGQNDFRLWRLKMKVVLVQQGHEDALKGDEGLQREIHNRDLVEAQEPLHDKVYGSVGSEPSFENPEVIMNIDDSQQPSNDINEGVNAAEAEEGIFDGKGVSRSRLKDILSQIWKLKGYWKFKTLKPGVWGIFFDKEEDCAEVLQNRPWIINGKLLIIKEWLEDGDWYNADMRKAIFWVMVSGLPTPYLNGVNSRTLAAKAGRFIRSDLADQRTVIRRDFLKFQVEAPPTATSNSKSMGKRPVQEIPRKQSLQQPPCTKPSRKVVRIKSNEPGSSLGKYLKVVNKGAPNPLDKRPGGSNLAPRVSRQDGRGRMARSVSPRALRIHQQDKFEPIPTLFHDPTDVSELVHHCPQPRKRKASLTLISYVQHLPENSGDFNTDLPELPAFSPSPDSSFKMGSGASTSSLKNDKRRKKGSRSKLSTSKKGKKPIGSSGEGGETYMNLINSLNLVEVQGLSNSMTLEIVCYSSVKEVFWKSLEEECSQCTLPWVLLGDLNCIRGQEEKSGGRLVSPAETKWLNNFMLNTGGVDLRFLGNKFTWQNKRFNGGLIRERLDRAVCSSDWILSYENAGTCNLSISISDHAPIIFDTHLFAVRSYIPFRFFEAWSWEDSCKREIIKAWVCSDSNATASFIRNINSSKKALQSWKKTGQITNEYKIQKLEKRLEWIQSQTISEALKIEETSVLSQIQIAWSKLECMWRQRSREIWLSLGDRNTRFFHAATVIRKRRNSIWAIKDKEGRIWKERKHIGGIINSYFQELFTSSRPYIDETLESLFVNRIDDQSNELISKTPSDVEIKEAVFCLHPLKAPGPDGFSGCFFRMYWDVVGTNLCATVKEFFQSAFIPGRWIAESSILTQEIIHKIRHKRGNGGFMALKLDMHKAYDKMEWIFLEKVLVANGFNDKSRKLLMACVTSVSYAVLLNGCPLKKLYPKRGLHQGDPLSPFLFLLCQEVLSKLISKAEAQGSVHGIKIAQSAASVSHLMFADDTILFSRANSSEAKKLMDCLSIYEAWSGQSCSKPKSGVLFSKNLSNGRKNNLLGILNIEQVKGEERHLGNPFVFKRRKKEDYLRFKESMLKKLEGWKMSRGYTIRTLADVSSGNDWNPELILQIFGTELGNCILTIPRIPFPFQDQVFWKHSQNGHFSVKAAYNVDQSWRFEPVKEIWKWIWGTDIHPRNSVLLWRILNDAIPTKSRLHFLPDKVCDLCDAGIENPLHLFCRCSFSKSIWFGGSKHIRIGDILGESLSEVLENLVLHFNDLPYGGNRVELLNYFGCVLSAIWHQRNEYYIENVPVNPVLALARAEKDFLEMQMVSRISKGDQDLGIQSKGGGETGIAAIAVDMDAGNWFVKTQRLQAQSALEGEFRAIFLAMSWAIDQGWREVIILSDSKVAINALSSSGTCPDWKLSNVYFSIINVSKYFLVCNFYFISRSLNLLADGLAKKARISSEMAVLYQGEGNPPVIPITFLA
uniref:Reverse transcriptase n=1 Tax=Cannabis sativa TaxID=3483 RepID=A0A803Q2M5_CANSA